MASSNMQYLSVALLAEANRARFALTAKLMSACENGPLPAVKTMRVRDILQSIFLNYLFRVNFYEVFRSFDNI